MAEDDSFDMTDEPVKKSGSKLKLEGIIPIIIIVAVILLIVFKTNLISSSEGIFKSSRTSILVLGSPSPEFIRVLNDAGNRDLIKQLRFRTIDSVQHNPKESFKAFDIIILDQTLSADKSITRTVGEAIKGFVQAGGKLIVVLNSGIERTGDPSVIGWKATFGDIIPVTCDPLIYSIPSCKQKLMVSGVIYSNRSDSKQGGYRIMYGIEKVPALESAGLLQTETFAVGIEGNEIAYLVDARSGMTYPAIVEKPMLLGKVLYFNYNPGLSEAIFINAIKYLK
ncbi:MAG: hypothetical protein WCY27_02275 [archaeon]